jgi:O-antigen ligase
MNRDVVDRWCERGILALVLAILVFGPLALGGVRALEFSIIEILTVAAALVWGVRLWISPRPQLLWPPICWAVVAFTLYALARYKTADIEYVARHEFLRILVYAFLFFVIINNLHRQETTQILSFTLVFLGLGLSFYALYQFLTGSERVWHFVSPYKHRASATYFCPNHLGGFLEMLLPLGLAYTLLGRVKPLTRVFLGYAALVIIAGIAVTVSRGSWVSAGLALLAFFAVLMFQRTYRIPALILLAALLAAGTLLVPRVEFFRFRYRQLATEEGRINDDLRFALWRPAWQMWRDNPWFGVGPAHFDPRFRAYRPEIVQMTPDRVHNDYLNTLTDWGVAGVALVLSAWVLLALGLQKTWRRVRLSSAHLGGQAGSNKFAFVVGASLGLFAILVHSGIDFNMHIPANAILAVTLMALLSAHIRFATDRYWLRAGAPVKILASLLILGGTVYLVSQSRRQAEEFVWLERAGRAPPFSADAIALLERAYKIEPMNEQTTYDLGAACQQLSREGGQVYAGMPGMDYRALAQKAMTWFTRGMELNRWDSRNYSGYGWCLDWLERPDESGIYFSQAETLDPNNYFNLNQIGLHYVQTGDLAAARAWFERSLRIEPRDNQIASSYLELSNLRMLEAVTNSISARMNFPQP